jgi:hypothetical protein
MIQARSAKTVMEQAPDRRIWRWLLISAALRNEYVSLELSGTRVGLDSGRATLAREKISTYVPFSLGNEDEGQTRPTVYVVTGLYQ